MNLFKTKPNKEQKLNQGQILTSKKKKDVVDKY